MSSIIMMTINVPVNILYDYVYNNKSLLNIIQLFLSFCSIKFW